MRPTSALASSPALLAGLSLGLVTVGLAVFAVDARADDPPPMVLRAPPPSSDSKPAVGADAQPARPAARRPVVPPKPSLPIEMTIVAASPDPPWTLRIVNIGDHPIRLAADTRLLTFDLDTGGKHETKVKCAAPAGMRPRSFPDARELYLDAGEVYVEDFDPRLYCFGYKIDLLRGGTNVHAHLGWPKASSLGRGPFAAQGTDRPEAFAALSELSAPTIQLGYALFAPMAPRVGALPPDEAADAQASSMASVDDVGTKPTSVKAASNGALPTNASTGGRPSSNQSEKSSYDPTAKKSDDDAPAAPPAEDRNAARVDVYVDRTSDADAPRNVVVNIRAVNEGRRELISALRGRMLSFTVEQLGPDNEPRQSFVCRGSERPHAMPIEAGRDLDAGQAVTIPIMLAEICPRQAFERPGLYRVRPGIDTTLEGEMLKQHPYIGKALARQSSLVRVATSRKPYQDDAPKVFTPPKAPAPAAPR